MSEILKESGKVMSVFQRDNSYGIALGKDNWFNGKGKATCKKTDQVDITYTLSDYNGKDSKSIEQVYIKDSSEAAPVKTETPGSSSPFNESKPSSIYQDDRQKSIVTQHCIKSALKLIEIQNNLEEEKMKPTMNNLFETALIVKSVYEKLITQ